MIKYLASALFVFSIFSVSGQPVNVVFDTLKWEIISGEFVEFEGRSAFRGIAEVKDVTLLNGSIMFDMYVDGQRSYPGIFFRNQGDGNYERIYFRPHRAGLYPDALQYTPAFNSVAGWQLYSGPGFTNHIQLPDNTWLPVKIDIQGQTAKVFVNNNQEPSLEVNDLKHPRIPGGFGLFGPANGTAYFSNFRYETSEHVANQPSVTKDSVREGVITSWELSKALDKDIFLTPGYRNYPRFYGIYFAGWEKITADSDGLLDISKYRKRNAAKPQFVMARTFVHSKVKKTVKLSFGYSDEISLFLNGKPLFHGNSAYRSRDPSFVGVVGYHDAVFLELQPGINEIFLMIKETFGGWGLMARLDQAVVEPVKDHGLLSRIWESDTLLLTPESALYDKERDIIFVSNFDLRYDPGAHEKDYTGFISKMDTDGKIIHHKWIEGLHAPTGMALWKKRLYTLERGRLVEIDISKGEILERYDVPGSDFLNDLVISPRGELFMTDTSPSDHAKSRIYRFFKGQVELWLESEEINRANGLLFDNNRLLVGNSGDGSVKIVDIETKNISRLCTLGAGVIDGIKPDGSGNYLISHWSGRIFRVSPDGDVMEISDKVGSENSADFEFITDKGLLIVPTFMGNTVSAYKYTSQSRD